MLDRIRKGQRWLTAIFVFAIGVVFVFFLGLGGSTPGGGPSAGPEADVVVFDDVRIGMNDYLRVRQQQEARLRDRLGDQFDADAMATFLDAQALQAVVNQMVLSQSALELGLVVSPEEVKDLLRNDPSLRDENGRFAQDEFDAQVKWEYGSQANFLNTMQRDLLQQKMFELLLTQIEIGDAEAFNAARYRTQEIQIAFVGLAADRLPEAHRPDEAAIAAYLDAHRESLQVRYDTETDRFVTPEQVVMRHILFSPDPSEGDEADQKNREQAEQALARLRDGEDFGALAAEFSGDPSSNQDGGKLGAISRGDVAPNLEAVVFELEPGTASEIVEGVEGLHIAWVDEKIDAARQPFDEAGLELAAEGAAEEATRALAQQLSQAVTDGQSLEEAARAAGLTLDRTGFFTRRRDGFIPGLARPSLEVLSAAFTLTPEAPSAAQVFEVGDQQVLIQLLERQDPDPETLAQAVENAREALELQQQNALVQAWIDNRRASFENDRRLQINSAVVAGR